MFVRFECSFPLCPANPQNRKWIGIPISCLSARMSDRAAYGYTNYPGNVVRAFAPMPGLVVTVTAAPGEDVTAGQKLVTLEAMKMETTVYAERDGKVAEVLVKPGTQVEAGDLLVRFE